MHVLGSHRPDSTWTMPFGRPTAIIGWGGRPLVPDFVLLIRLSREELVPPICIIGNIGCGVGCRVGAI